MRTKLGGWLVQVTPAIVSIFGVTTVSAYATDAPTPKESNQSTVVIESISTEFISTESITLSSYPHINWIEPVTSEAKEDTIASELNMRPSSVTRSIFTNSTFVKPIEKTSTNTTLTEVDEITKTNRSHGTVMPEVIPSSSELEQPTSSIDQDLNQAHPIQLSVADITETPIGTDASSATPIQLIMIAPSDLERLTPDHWQIAQIETTPEPDTPGATPTVGEPSSPRWRFNLVPYGFVPLSVDGSATVRDFTADVNLGLDDLLDPLNFAAAGRVEAWRGNLGFIFDGAYFSLGQENTISRLIPDCLCGIFPSEIDTEIDVQYGQFDLGVGYRVAANSANAATEFELGPLVFDAIVGVRIYAIQQEIDISTNIGSERNLEHNNTIVTPLASGRFRWNVSPNLAGWVRGDIAGFGIGGTLLAVSATGGLDWMFSGNTSLLLAYRISSLQYTADIRGEDFELDLLLQGPYAGVVFRF